MKGRVINAVFWIGLTAAGAAMVSSLVRCSDRIQARDNNELAACNARGGVLVMTDRIGKTCVKPAEAKS